MQPYYSVLRARLQILKWEAGFPHTHCRLPRLSVAVRMLIGICRSWRRTRCRPRYH